MTNDDPQGVVRSTVFERAGESDGDVVLVERRRRIPMSREEEDVWDFVGKVCGWKEGILSRISGRLEQVASGERNLRGCSLLKVTRREDGRMCDLIVVIAPSVTLSH